MGAETDEDAVQTIQASFASCNLLNTLVRSWGCSSPRFSPYIPYMNGISECRHPQESMMHSFEKLLVSNFTFPARCPRSRRTSYLALLVLMPQRVGVHILYGFLASAS